MTNRLFWLPIPSNRAIPAWIVVLLLMSIPSLHADLFVYEGFDYPAGPLVGQAGGTGWSEPWHGVNGANAHGLVAADSLKAPQAIATKGGHMQTNEGDSPMMRALSTPLFKATGVTWISFLARNDSSQIEATYSFLKFAAAGGNDDASLHVGKGYSGKNWEMKMGSQTQDLGVASDNTTVLFVLRIESTGKPENDSVQVFVNPAIASAPTTPSATMTGVTLKPLDEVVIQSGNGIKAFSYDEIRMGTTFADVVPPTTDGSAK